MRGGVGARLAASPTMVGAVTVLVAIVAVFLAYNANSGLPFVPTYRVSAQLPDSDQLLPGNEVRIGGVRVGVIDAITPQQTENGKVSAKLDLELDSQVDPLPRDSTVMVRTRSALGLKYLEINRGDSPEGFEAGSVLPLSAVKAEPVDIDEVLSTFDEPTQEAIRANLFEFGNALAGRGPALNSAIGSLRPLLPRLERVSANLADPDTRLGRLISALAATAAEVAPVATEQARMFASLDTTFAALAGVARPYIQETISESPPTLAVATETLPRLRPFLSHSTALFADLEPGVEALRVNAPALADALEVGAPVLRRSPELYRELAPTAQALEDFSDDPGVNGGLDRLEEAAGILTPTLRFIGPAQTVCGYGGILLDNLASVTSHYNGQGTYQRFEIFEPALGPDSEGSPSDAPANTAADNNELHYNPYPNTASPGQTPVECEAGNEGYQLARTIGNAPNPPTTVTDPEFQR
jgi:virulence factor Mce-like protein